MKRLLLMCACALAAGQLFGAQVTGRVGFLTKRGQNPVTTETLIWLEPTSGTRTTHRPSVIAQMTTRGKTLLPHVLAIPVGSTVNFPNEDPISHNIFSLTAANQFDLGLYRTGAGKSHLFEKAGIINVYCNVHPNMSGVIHVMATPYYTFADTGGAFALPDVVPGKYDLVAWNEQGGVTRIGAVDVPASGNVEVTLDSRGYRATQHPNKLGKPYEAPRSRDY
jgi:plastocyanin